MSLPVWRRLKSRVANWLFLFRKIIGEDPFLDLKSNGDLDDLVSTLKACPTRGVKSIVAEIISGKNVFNGNRIILSLPPSDIVENLRRVMGAVWWSGRLIKNHLYPIPLGTMLAV